jgi:hypothetical protein
MMTVWKQAAHALLAIGGVVMASGAAHAADRPVLAELFTSLGCSSCPPADVVLGELAKRDDVLALSFHIDYWDGLGWKDPYSLHLATERQRHYAEILGADSYTPQLVVDGRSEGVGSSRSSVAGMIRGGHGAAVPAAIHEQGGRIDVRIDAVPAPSDGAKADILLVTFDAAHKTPVRGGENGGRTLETFNDVRSLRRIGEWRGEPVTLTATRAAEETGERAAVIVQSADGKVWALAATPAGAS